VIDWGARGWGSLAWLVVACSTRSVPPAVVPSVTVSPASGPILGREKAALFAQANYELGDDSGVTEEDRAAFRQVCLKNQDERAEVLEKLLYHAQMHRILWRDWYEKNCTNLVLPDGKTIAWPEMGITFNPPVPWVCSIDAGVPPAQVYQKTEQEEIAQRQKLACERAQ
jgi:hypothetical protein